MSPIDEIVTSPNPCLKRESAPIEHIDDTIKKTAERMLVDMYAAEGCGLAAAQIGLNLQLVVIDVDYGIGRNGIGKKNPYVLINPKLIVADGDPSPYTEGCLSWPGISAHFERPSHVIVHALNLDGELIEYEAEGNLLATCLQHEIDHLHGITIVDHLPTAERAAALQKYKIACANGARPGDVDY